MGNFKGKTKGIPAKSIVDNIKDPVLSLLQIGEIGTLEEVEWAVLRIGLFVEQNPAFQELPLQEQIELKEHLGAIMSNWYSIFRMRDMVLRKSLAFMYVRANYTFEELKLLRETLNNVIKLQGGPAGLRMLKGKSRIK